MTEPSNLPPDDRELEEFLARRGELSRRYREAQPAEPAPPRLDAPILAQARQELRRGGRPARRFRPQRLATAATVLLVAGLAWMVRQQPVSLESAPAAPQSAPTLADAVPPAAPRVAAAPVSTAAVADQAKPAPEKARRRAPSKASPLPPLVMQASPPPAVAAPAPAPPPLPTPAPAPLLQPPPAPAAAPAASAAAELEASREDVMAVRRTSTAPSYTPPPPAAFAPAAPAAAMPAAKAESAACRSPPRAAAQAQADPEHGLDDAAWLEQIRRLQAADPAAARNELACFAALRPRAVVPDDLRPLLPAPP